jgi:hypothetical protein
MYYQVSGFALANALAQTRNRDLIAQQFKAAGDEFFGSGFNEVDGPVLGPLGRVPQGQYIYPLELALAIILTLLKVDVRMRHFPLTPLYQV